ncbi:MAG: hypothetical protein ACLUEK_05235 [Oscillospiraceae bacterium]
MQLPQAADIRDEGSGDIEAEWCIGVATSPTTARETGKNHDITYEDPWRYSRGRGPRLCPQVTNIDGENKIFDTPTPVGVCNALRPAALLPPNLSRSAYVAESDPEKASPAASAETCPSSAVRLGRLTVAHPYPRHERPTTPSGARPLGQNTTTTSPIQTYPTSTAPARWPARRTSPSAT